MNTQRIAIIIVAGLGLVSTFLPWAVEAGGTEIPGTRYSGWITFILFLIPAVVALLGDRSKLLRGTFLYVAIIAALSAAAIGLWEIIDMRSESAAAEYGLNLVMLCGLVIPLAAFIIGEKAGGKAASGSRKSGAFSHRSEVGKKAAPD